MRVRRRKVASAPILEQRTTKRPVSRVRKRGKQSHHSAQSLSSHLLLSSLHSTFPFDNTSIRAFDYVYRPWKLWVGGSARSHAGKREQEMQGVGVRQVGKRAREGERTLEEEPWGIRGEGRIQAGERSQASCQAFQEERTSGEPCACITIKPSALVCVAQNTFKH